MRLGFTDGFHYLLKERQSNFSNSLGLALAANSNRLCLFFTQIKILFDCLIIIPTIGRSELTINSFLSLSKINFLHFSLFNEEAWFHLSGSNYRTYFPQCYWVPLHPVKVGVSVLKANYYPNPF
jgi:hypothetical protein